MVEHSTCGNPSSSS